MTSSPSPAQNTTHFSHEPRSTARPTEEGAGTHTHCTHGGRCIPPLPGKQPARSAPYCQDSRQPRRAAERSLHSSGTATSRETLASPGSGPCSGSRKALGGGEGVVRFQGNGAGRGCLSRAGGVPGTALVPSERGKGDGWSCVRVNHRCQHTPVVASPGGSTNSELTLLVLWLKVRSSSGTAPVAVQERGRSFSSSFSI